jgi:hypothetical protein
MEEALTPGPNFNRPVKDLVYTDLLTSTFTQTSQSRQGYPNLEYLGVVPSVCLLREQVTSFGMNRSM